jgi:hypothetical protein
VTRLRLVFAALSLLAVALNPLAAHAARPDGDNRPTAITILRGAGGISVPPEWAGIWNTEDTTFVCNTLTVTDISSSIDTLCAGQAFDPDPSTNWDCTGTVTSTTGDVTCTGSFSFSGCTINFVSHFVVTRNGDTARVIETFTTTYTPPLCAFQPDSCEETHSVYTRTGPPPPTCSTPTQRSTWGQVKVLYR